MDRKPSSNYIASKFNEAFLTISGHGDLHYWNSEQAWNSLSPEYQERIKEKVDVWKEKEREMIRKGEENLLKEMKAAVAEVTEPDVKSSSS